MYYLIHLSMACFNLIRFHNNVTDFYIHIFNIWWFWQGMIYMMVIKNVSSHALYLYIEEYIDVHGPMFFNFRKITAKLLHYCIIWKLCNKSYGFRWHINVLLIQVMECGAKYFHTHGRKTYPAFTLLEYLIIFKLY